MFTSGDADALPPSTLVDAKRGDDSSDTRTPPTRSTSPSSDSGASRPLSGSSSSRHVHGADAKGAEVGEGATTASDVGELSTADEEAEHLGSSAAEAFEALGSAESVGVVADAAEVAAKLGELSSSFAADATAALAPTPEPGCESVTAPAAGNAPSSGGPVPHSDRKIIQALAASDRVHQRLLRAASAVPELLVDSVGEADLVASVELYGSLSLNGSGRTVSTPTSRWQQDWPAYYVNPNSDVDFVVKMKPGVAPEAVAQRLLKKGPWRMVGQVHVHKFASTQYTLLGSLDAEDQHGEEAVEDTSFSEVYLDITCIDNSLHFDRFQRRQEAFRTVFLEVRAQMEAYKADGVLAFDAYVHLLKAFAAKVPGNGLTGFQATCIGLFTLQIGHFKMKLTKSIAMCLFEGFLRFCLAFYGDHPQHSYRSLAIDLSHGGRWMPRLNQTWRSEVYFMAAEDVMMTKTNERMNVAHSLDPACVAAEAQALLERAFVDECSGQGAFDAPCQELAEQTSKAAAATA